MQFHHHGYVSGDPRVQPAAGVGIDRPEELPDLVDVLIVGTGPAGMVAAAQLSQFPGVTTRIIDRRGGRLVIGQADGIQARSVETFQAFGFADRITSEAYRITEMCVLEARPGRPVAHHPHRPHARRRDRRQRVPAPARQPGARARLLRRVDGELADPDDARLRVGVRAPRGHRRRRLPGRRDARSAPPATTRARSARSAPSTSSAATAPAAGCATRSASHPRRRPGEPRLGRHGRAGRHRLPRHPHQVRDPVGLGRQHPADPARGRAPVPDVRRPRRPRDRAGGRRSRHDDRADHRRRRTRSCTRTDST